MTRRGESRRAGLHREHEASTLPQHDPRDATRDDAPWRPTIAWRTRDFVRSRMDQGQAHRFCEVFARLAPRPLQRWAEARYDFPVSRHVRDNPLLLVRVPRTGSLSLALTIYGRTDHVPHRTASFYRSSDPALFAAATSLAVVRDPWQRVWSSYRYARSGGTRHLGLDPGSRRMLDGIATFEAFVHDLLVPNAHRLHALDPILHEQAAYVCDDRDRVIVDRLFAFERMGDVDAFLRGRGHRGGLPHVNARTSRVRGGLPRDVRPEVVDAIGRVYARDVATFGYARADPHAPVLTIG